MRDVVILFAKSPVAGRVKNRLAAEIGDEAAVQLHSAFVEDMARALMPHFDLELHTDIPSDAWPGLKVPRRLQISGDLGERILFALDHELGRHGTMATVIGTDAPTLPVAHVEALVLMVRDGADVALGPSADGGYWGIAARTIRARMFADVQWSGPESLRQTMASCARSGLSVCVGPQWYDIDTIGDLRRLRDDPCIFERPLTRHLVESLLPG